MIEFKWLMVTFAVVMSSLAAADAASKYSLQQCRVAAIAASMPAEEIAKVCK